MEKISLGVFGPFIPLKFYFFSEGEQLVLVVEG